MCHIAPIAKSLTISCAFGLWKMHKNHLFWLQKVKNSRFGSAITLRWLKKLTYRFKAFVASGQRYTNCLYLFLGLFKVIADPKVSCSEQEITWNSLEKSVFHQKKRLNMPSRSAINVKWRMTVQYFWKDTFTTGQRFMKRHRVVYKPHISKSLTSKAVEKQAEFSILNFGSWFLLLFWGFW